MFAKSWGVRFAREKNSYGLHGNSLYYHIIPRYEHITNDDNWNQKMLFVEEGEWKGTLQPHETRIVIWGVHRNTSLQCGGGGDRMIRTWCHRTGRSWWRMKFIVQVKSRQYYGLCVHLFLSMKINGRPESMPPSNPLTESMMKSSNGTTSWRRWWAHNLWKCVVCTQLMWVGMKWLNETVCRCTFLSNIRVSILWWKHILDLFLCWGGCCVLISNCSWATLGWFTSATHSEPDKK